MVLADLQSWIGWHFVFEGIFVFGISAVEDVLVHIQHAVFDIFLTKSGEELTIQIISDSSSVQDLADHVL